MTYANQLPKIYWHYAGRFILQKDIVMENFSAKETITVIIPMPYDIFGTIFMSPFKVEEIELSPSSITSSMFFKSDIEFSKLSSY